MARNYQQELPALVQSKLYIVLNIQRFEGSLNPLCLSDCVRITRSPWAAWFLLTPL
jgi:hypothetical protein